MRPDYPQIRCRAHELAAEDAAGFLPSVPVRITDIDASALSACADTWKGHHPSGYGGYEWPYLWHRFCRQEYRSFHCALWHGPMLCALAIGSVPRGHSHLTMRFMESRPQGQPLKGYVARIILVGARFYALGLGLPQIRLENPAPGLDRWYRALGFDLALQQGAIRYLAMNLSQVRD